MPSSKVYFSIPPLNDNSVSSAGDALSGGFSNKNGNGNIKFAISSQDRLLDTSDLYLTGQILHVKSDGTPLTLKAAAATTKAEYSANNGTALQAVTNQNISNWNGVESMVKKIFIQSKKTSVNISEHRNYPMYNAARNAWTHNKQDYLVSPLIRANASGTDATHANRHATTMDNATTGASGQMPNVSGQEDPNYGFPFSFKLDTALLNNTQPMHLGQNFLGGLLINLELNNENGFYSDRFRDMGNNQTDADVLTGSYYIVKNLRLQGRLLVPTPQDLQGYNPNFVLNDRFNLINEVNSSTNNSKYTPNVNAVRSIVNMFLDQSQENNRSANQTNFRNACGLENYQQNKNNIRQPQDFVVEVVPNLLTKTKQSGAGTVTANTYGNKGLAQGDSEVRAFWQRALLNGDLADKTVCSLSVAKGQIDADYADRATDGTSQNDGVGNLCEANALGIGLDYTHHMGMVSNYSGSADYDILIRSGVNSGDAVLPVSRRSVPEIQQSYVKNVAAFNSESLVKTM